MGDITYGQDVRLELDELGSSYHVNLPVGQHPYSRDLTTPAKELRAADPFHIATIAHKWGFTHLGRFSAAHEGQFGELPGDTLRATR